MLTDASGYLSTQHAAVSKSLFWISSYCSDKSLAQRGNITNCMWGLSLGTNVKTYGNRSYFSCHLLILAFCGINKFKCLSLSNGATRGGDWSEQLLREHYNVKRSG